MTISVIIPVLNEAQTIGTCLRSVRRQLPCQIIVVDGGSSDQTLAHAADADLVFESERGRARQMNAGAERASGEILLFLHSDCELEPGAIAEARRILANESIAAGCFSMRVRASGGAYRCIDACASARVRVTGLIYGDQGMYLRRSDFAKLGGFPTLNLMEDVFFSLRLRTHGRIVVAHPNIYVSPRRWQKTGLVRQTLRNWMLTGLAAMGVSPDRLAVHYPTVR